MAWLAVQLLILTFMFVCYCSVLILFSRHLVVTYLDSSSHLTFPTSMESLKHCLHVLLSLQSKAPAQVLALFSAAYVFKQSFSIPGSVFLNLLAGALFPFYVAFPLVCVLTALGASVCFLFSRHIFARLLLRCFAARIQVITSQIQSNTENLIYFLLFIRIFPFSPNWLINIACPLVGVPLDKFFLSVLLGLMPYNYICVQSGSILASIRSVNDILTRTTMLKLCSIAVITLMPILLKKYCNERLRQKEVPKQEDKVVNLRSLSPRGVTVEKCSEKVE